MDRPEQLMDLIRSRRSIRKFKPHPVPPELIEGVLEAARWAPSNHNRQGWKFIILADRTLISRLAFEVRAEVVSRLAREGEHLSDQASDIEEHCTAFRRAPVIMVVLYKEPTAISLSFLADVEDADLVSGEYLSAALATQNLLLAAHAVGLGACVMTGPLVARESIHRAVDLPPGYKVACLIAVGFPAECPQAPRRKRLDQIVEFRGDLP